MIWACCDRNVHVTRRMVKIRASTSGQTRRSAAVSRPPGSPADPAGPVGAVEPRSGPGDRCSPAFEPDSSAGRVDGERRVSGSCGGEAAVSGGADALVSRGPPADVGAALPDDGASDVAGMVATAGPDGVLAERDSVGPDSGGRPLGTDSGRVDEGTPPRSR